MVANKTLSLVELSSVTLIGFILVGLLASCDVSQPDPLTNEGVPDFDLRTLSLEELDSRRAFAGVVRFRVDLDSLNLTDPEVSLFVNRIRRTTLDNPPYIFNLDTDAQRDGTYEVGIGVREAGVPIGAYDAVNGDPLYFQTTLVFDQSRPTRLPSVSGGSSGDHPLISWSASTDDNFLGYIIQRIGFNSTEVVDTVFNRSTTSFVDSSSTLAVGEIQEYGVIVTNGADVTSVAKTFAENTPSYLTRASIAKYGKPVFTQDGSQMYWASDWDSISAWDVNNSVSLRDLQTQTGVIGRFVLEEASNSILVNGNGSQIQLDLARVDLADGSVVEHVLFDFLGAPPASSLQLVRASDGTLYATSPHSAGNVLELSSISTLVDTLSFPEATRQPLLALTDDESSLLVLFTHELPHSTLEANPVFHKIDRASGSRISRTLPLGDLIVTRISPDRNRIYAVARSEVFQPVIVYDSSFNIVDEIPLQAWPLDMHVGENNIYTAHDQSMTSRDVIRITDIATKNVVKEIQIGSAVRRIIASPDERVLFVVASGNGVSNTRELGTLVIRIED